MKDRWTEFFEGGGKAAKVGWRGRRTKDLTRLLKVGQKVKVLSGPVGYDGLVSKITPAGIEVQSLPVPGCLYFTQGVFRFDACGNGCDGRHTFEFGPYDLIYDDPRT